MAIEIIPIWYVTTWQTRLRSYLYDLGYQYGPREIVVAYAEANGTVRGCEWVGEGDAEGAEGIVRGGR